MNDILANINSPEDIYKLNFKQMDLLADEIRKFLIETVSKTGGHLASNLGVVELTIALFYAFNIDNDKIIWDVGHQSYIHKILTGRKEMMSTLRQMDGLSGFPKREESKYDVFDTGHSSTSISAAVGMARARDLKKEDYNIISVIGDGALTGGMAFEALNDIGKSKTKMIVILNDNEMSISKNVGGLSTHLSKARTASKYLSTKKDIENFLQTVPGLGKSVKKYLRLFKEGIKKMIIPSMLFEELGLTYLGPIDGHNIAEMVDVFESAKKIDEPLLIHICTTKGKGYKFAEQHPNDYHGVSPFDIETGKPLKKSKLPSYSGIFGNKLCEIAKDNQNVVAISAAMIDGTGLGEFARQFPERVFDVGIAEQHAVTMAAGFAANGMCPVVAVYSSFLQRAYDQVVHDVATQNLHVVFAIDRAGLVGNDGETHQGVFDEGFLVQLPNMTVLAPCDYIEFEMMIEYAINKFNAPIAIRYPRGTNSSVIQNSCTKLEYGKGIIVEQGNDITIVANGRMVDTAVRIKHLLAGDNISAEVINLRFLKPIDMDLINSSVKKTGKLLIIDETSRDVSISMKISSEISCKADVIIKTFPDIFIRHGNTDDLFKKYKLDADSIVEEIKKIFNK